MPTEDSEQDVDAQVGTAATLEEDTDGREEDGKNDLANIAIEKKLKLVLKSW